MTSSTHPSRFSCQALAWSALLAALAVTGCNQKPLCSELGTCGGPLVGEFVLAMHCALYVLTPVMLVLMPRIIGEGALAELIRTVGLLVVLGTFPASVAIMAMTRNIETALNPFSIARVVAVLRSRYVLLLLWCAVIVVITSSVFTAQATDHHAEDTQPASKFRGVHRSFSQSSRPHGKKAG